MKSALFIFMDKIKKSIAQIISKKIKVKQNEILESIEKPPNRIKADFALPCFRFSKKLKKNPETIALDIFSVFENVKKPFLKSVEPLGPYVNFYLDWQYLGGKILREVLKKKEKYGSAKKRKKILVEHTSANPDGPLHIGHFRNSVLGDSIARILKFSGNRVRTEFYVNDTGRQIAIAVMESMRTEKRLEGKPDWWVLNLYISGNRKIEKDPKLEKELRNIMLRYESGDKELLGAYSFIVDSCLEGHKETLKRIGIKIDNFVKESKFIFNGDVYKILDKIKKLPQGKIDGKRIWVDLKKAGIDREFTLTRSDGTTIYPARDLAYHKDKFSRARFNISIIGTDQKFYFKQLIETLKLLFPKKVKNYKVIFYEFLLLPTGSLSTRKGRFISVDELVDKVIERAREVVEEKMPHYNESLKNKIAEVVGVGALKYAMLKVSPEKTYTFNIEDILNFEGNTAPYIQYTYARACSILRKAGIKRYTYNAKLLEREEEISLLKKLSEFPRIVSDAAEQCRPHFIANYAYELSSLFNEFYQKVPVIHSQQDLKTTRLSLVKAVTIVLRNALGLLGIEAPERM